MTVKKFLKVAEQEANMWEFCSKKNLTAAKYVLITYLSKTSLNLIT